MAPSSRSDTKKTLRETQRQWLNALVELTGLKLSQIANEAGVSDTTLTRLANNPNYDGLLSSITITRLTERFKVPGPEDYAGGRRPLLGGFAEAERVDVRHDPVVAALIEHGGPGLDPWRLKTDALAAAGYLAGDIVIVDLNLAPRPQDAVCAQVYDWKGGRAETVWRVFDPPFLVGHAFDRGAYKPLLVDNDRVIIKGVIVRSFRPHPLSSTR